MPVRSACDRDHTDARGSPFAAGLAGMLILENTGLLIGTVTALIAVATHLRSVEARVNSGH